MQKQKLINLYLQQKKSAAEIAKLCECSINKVNYWLNKYKIPKRSIADAVYIKWNPHGDPFAIRKISTIQLAFLYGAGLGLYWGEGNKSNKVSVRLGNTDPRLIKFFIKFLDEIYQIDKTKLRFGIQIFSDMPPKDVLMFWQKHLGVSSSQFYKKLVVTPARSLGTYHHKTKHGVLTIYFNNRNLRDTICGAIDNINDVLLELKPM